MKLFDVILDSIANPELKTESNDLADLLGGIKSAAKEQDTPPDLVETAVSALGKHVKAGLQEYGGSREELVEEAASVPQATPELISKLFGSQNVESVSDDVSQKTGIQTETIIALLPVLIPIVMKLFRSGGSKSDGASSQMNPLLQGFLDSDNDGDVDLADVFKLAGPYLDR